MGTKSTVAAVLTPAVSDEDVQLAMRKYFQERVYRYKLRVQLADAFACLEADRNVVVGISVNEDEFKRIFRPLVNDSAWEPLIENAAVGLLWGVPVHIDKSLPAGVHLESRSTIRA